MPPSPGASAYLADLQKRFHAYRAARFGDRAGLFEDRGPNGPVVFARDHAARNLLVPPFASAEQGARIVAMVPDAERHRHFASMRSSQALAQSVFASIAVLDRQPALAGIVAECGRPAFGLSPGTARLTLERPVGSLGEPRPTSVDVWLEGRERVTVEASSRRVIGTCSRPRLRPGDARDHCDGSHTHQRGRGSRCALTEIGVRYWDHLDGLFGWPPDRDHRPCPLAATYQLARNVMAACVRDDGRLNPEAAHALVLYDHRNPAMAPGGIADRQWQAATAALRIPGLLRGLSWQSLVAQWPADPVLDWLKTELEAKYGFG